MNEMVRAFSGQILLLILIAGAAVTAAVAVRRQRHWPFGLVPAATCLALGSSLAIAVVTLTRQTGARSPGHLQLHPFVTMRTYLGDPSDLAFYLCGNIALFAPLGFFLYLAVRRGIIVPTVVAVAASVTVEICQIAIWSRSTDIDDVMLNSVGGLIGVLAASIAVRLIDLPGFSRSTGRRRSEPRAAADPEERRATLLPMR